MRRTGQEEGPQPNMSGLEQLRQTCSLHKPGPGSNQDDWKFWSGWWEGGEEGEEEGEGVGSGEETRGGGGREGGGGGDHAGEMSAVVKTEPPAMEGIPPSPSSPGAVWQSFQLSPES